MTLKSSGIKTPDKPISNEEMKVRCEQAVLIPEEKCTPEDRFFRAVTYTGAMKSFLYFLDFVRIIEPPTQTNHGGIVKFQLWEHTKLSIAALLKRKQISILKSRQIGWSWLLAAYALWYALARKGATVMLFSKGEEEAKELLSKCGTIYRNLPDFMRAQKVYPDSATEMAFTVMESRIKAFASTENAGISFTASVIIADEHEEHPYAEQNYFASKPTRDAGGQYISVFTINKMKQTSLARQIFIDAMAKKNDFCWIFFPWHVRPGRDQKWYDEVKRNIPRTEMAKLTPELFMEGNYPASIEEALRSAETISAFNSKALDGMMSDSKAPIESLNGFDSKIVHIYQDFSLGNYYIAGTDTSHGVGQDFSVTALLNVKTGAVVADIISNNISPEMLAYHTVKMLEHYKNPLWYIESNDWGGATIAAAQKIGYKNLGYQDDKKEKPGFNTLRNERIELFGELIPAINNRQITIFNPDGIRQFFTVIRNVKKAGRIEASEGQHDDYPVAVGIAWLKRKEVQTDISNQSVYCRSYI